MNYKTTLVVTAMAVAALAALGSAFPMVGTAFASNGGGGNGGGEFENEQGNACNFATAPQLNNCAGNINQQGENNFQQGVSAAEED